MLVLFHDYTSAASAVAVARVQRLADEGAPIEFAGIEAIGVDMALPVTIDVQAALLDLADAAAAEGLVLRAPRLLPPSGWAHVVEELAEAEGLGASWRATCYRAFWESGVDLSALDVLLELATGAGLTRAAVQAALSDRSRLAAVRRRSAGHRANGVGGVPTMLAQRTLVPGLLDESDLRALAALG